MYTVLGCNLEDELRNWRSVKGSLFQRGKGRGLLLTCSLLWKTPDLSYPPSHPFYPFAMLLTHPLHKYR